MIGAVGLTSVLGWSHAGARRIWWWQGVCLCALGLAACAPAPDIGFRDTTVPITATTRFTPQAFAGQWQVVEAYPSAVFPDCADQQWHVDTQAETPLFKVRCSGDLAFDTPMTVDPRGVLQLSSSDLDSPERALWVMWMDEGARTAVIGTPSGEMGWIVNRTSDLRADRRAAAREVMAFNGYDITQLPERAP